jgi:hypothetical protein
VFPAPPSTPSGVVFLGGWRTGRAREGAFICPDTHLRVQRLGRDRWALLRTGYPHPCGLGSGHPWPETSSESPTGPSLFVHLGRRVSVNKCRRPVAQTPTSGDVRKGRDRVCCGGALSGHGWPERERHRDVLERPRNGTPCRGPSTNISNVGVQSPRNPRTWRRASVIEPNHAHLRQRRETDVACVFLEAFVLPEEGTRHRRRDHQHVEQGTADQARHQQSRHQQ